MSFADALAETGGRKYTNKVAEILESLDDEDREQALEALGNAAISNRRLSKAFHKLGHSVSEGAINNWRSREVR